MRNRRLRDAGEEYVSSVASNANGTSTDFTGGLAATAGKRNMVTKVVLTNTSATPINVDIRDGAAGAVLITLAAPAGLTMTYDFDEMPLRGSVNTPIAFDGSAGVTTLLLCALGYKSAIP